MKKFSPSEFDLQLMRLATAHSSSDSAKGRELLRGKVQKMIWQHYKVEENREAIWNEWLKIADVRRYR